MSSPCRTEAAGRAGALALAALVAACHPAEGHSGRTAPFTPPSPPRAVSELLPGEALPPAPDSRGPGFETDPASVAQGKRLYAAYNCGGCHFAGGGGIGPAFMGKTWRYGGRIDQIHDSVDQGRPDGMPAWRGRISDPDIWRIAAYVRSLSTPGTQEIELPDAPPPSSAPPADPNHQGGQTSPS